MFGYARPCSPLSCIEGLLKRFALGNFTRSVVHAVLRQLGQFSGRVHASVTKCELSHGVIGIDEKIIFEVSSVAWCCEQNLRTAILRTSVGRGSNVRMPLWIEGNS